MAKIEVQEIDVQRVSVLLTALKKGKWELEGEEILAFAQVTHWAIELKEKMKASLAEKPEPPKETPKNGTDKRKLR